MMLFSSLLVLMFQQIQIKLNNRQLERCRWWYFRLDCQFIICFWPCTNVGYGIFLHICSWVQHFYHAIVKYDIFFDNEVKSWKSILFYNNILIFIIIFFGYFNKSLFHIQFTSLQLKNCRMHVSNKFQEMITELLSTSFCSVAIGILSKSSVHAWILLLEEQFCLQMCSNVYVYSYFAAVYEEPPAFYRLFIKLLCFCWKKLKKKD